MSRSTIITLLFIAAIAAHAANPPTGHASDQSVEVSAMFLDAAAVKQAAGSDFNNAYTVVEVTVTPKGDKPIDVEPDDFLLRISSSSDSSGPMAASQIYVAGNALVLHSEKETIGITQTDPRYSGVSIAHGSGSADNEAIDALQKKMLQPGKTSAPVTGLLFFPLAKKRARDLDLVYSSPTGKVHISFR
jgi:hypothetical protein